MIESLKCRKTKTLLDAMQAINENVKAAVFIVDENDKFCGVLTDGDIRRLLLDGHSLQEKIEVVIKGDAVYAMEGDSSEDMLEKLNEKIRIIPVLDKNFHIIDYVEFRHDIHVPVALPDLKGSEFKYLVDAFLSTWISSKGEYIQRFEDGFADFCECKYGVSTSNGTVALHLALIACGIGAGDEVIIPDLTFAATANAVLHANAIPVMVDVEPDSWCIDPDEICKAITPKTKAIIPVHLYGQPCAMDRILNIAEENNLIVIEDCAEAHGARFQGKRVGSFGLISCFSFFGNKIITTGEGGMCVTNSSELSQRMKILRDHGMSPKKRYWHECIGYNYRMTNLQAAIGTAQLERINKILDKRKNIELRYRKYLSSIPGVEFQRNDLPEREKITWLVTILFEEDQRDFIMRTLKNEGVDFRPLFYPLSSMDIYSDYIFSNTVSKNISARGLSFPTGTDLSDSILEKIRLILNPDYAIGHD